MDLDQASHNLAQILDELESLNSQMSALELQRNVLLEKAAHYRSILAPVHRVSDDILSEIFSRCLPDSHNTLTSIHTAPLLLTRVYQRWRDLVFISKSLWSGLHIVLPDFKEVDERLSKSESIAFKAYIQHLLQWIGRAGTHYPVSISIAVEPDAEWQYDVFLYTMNALASFSAQIKSLSFSSMPLMSHDKVMPSTVMDEDDLVFPN